MAFKHRGDVERRVGTAGALRRVAQVAIGRERGKKRMLTLSKPLDHDAVGGAPHQQRIASLAQVDAIVLAMTELIHLPDMENRIGRDDELCGRVEYKAELTEHVFRYAAQRGQIEGWRVGGDVRLIDRPLQARDVGQIR